MSMMKTSLFSNAIKQVKQSQTSQPTITIKSKLYSSNIDEDIDFNMESDLLGHSPNKLRSTIICRENQNNRTPYSNNSKSNIKTITFKKTEAGMPKKIVLNRQGMNSTIDKLIVKKDNTSWKHDLFVDESPNSNYVVFVRNLPRYMVESKLMEYFSKYGDIIGLNVI